MLWLILLAVLLSAMLASYSYTILAVQTAEAEFPPAGQFISVEQKLFHYVTLGSGQPVVLLHGNAGSLQDYPMPLLEQLSQQYQVYALDRPGHGYSDRSINSAMPSVQMHTVRAALDTLGVEKPILVGHSWSAVLVLAYALYYADEIAGIVLLAPLAYEYDVALPPAWLAQSSALEILLKLVPVTAIARRRIKPIVQSSFAPVSVPHDYLKASQALWSRPRQIQATLQDSTMIQPVLDALSSRYREIRVPTAIVVGQDDQLINPEQNAYRLHAAIANSEFIPLPNAGHAIPQTQFHAVIDAVSIVHQKMLQSGTSESTLP